MTQRSDGVTEWRRGGAWAVWVAGLIAILLAAVPARADIDPVSGIDFVRIGAVGNAPYQSGIPNALVNGRGGVDYAYSIGRFEVTSAQWVEFMNAVYDRPVGDTIPFVRVPDFWGGVPTTPNNPGGRRWTTTPASAMLPVGNVSWRMAAVYCNFLNSGRSSERAGLLAGSYDTASFGFIGNIFTDQLAHSPGARYTIPTWDESLKAANFDPNRVNSDGTRGGWWQYSNGSDTPYVYGPPGALVNGVAAQANAGWDSRTFPGRNPFGVPLGAYAGVSASPWGLLDVAGGTTEWTESYVTGDLGDRVRIFKGSHWAQDAFQSRLNDSISEYGSEYPHVPTFEFGLRVASNVVPAPSTVALGAGVLLIQGAISRRRSIKCSDGHSVSRTCSPPA